LGGISPGILLIKHPELKAHFMDSVMQGDVIEPRGVPGLELKLHGAISPD
jgi:hypothetical protein